MKRIARSRTALIATLLALALSMGAESLPRPAVVPAAPAWTSEKALSTLSGEESGRPLGPVLPSRPSTPGAQTGLPLA